MFWIVMLGGCAPHWTPIYPPPSMEDDHLMAPEDSVRVPREGTQHIWLAMDGLSVVDGPDSDSSVDLSFIIGSHFGAASVDFSPWTRTEDEEDAMVGALYEQFAGYDIAIHRQRPMGVFTTLVISDFSDGPSHGVAPVDCGNADAADIAFLYRATEVSQDWLQTAAAHELGHSFGLSHVVDTHDPMYWLSGGEQFGVSPIDLAHSSYDCVGGQVQDAPALLEVALGVVDVEGPLPWWNGAFADDEGNTHESAIDAIAAEGLTVGCGMMGPEPHYCPSDKVSRGQMVTFLQRALDLQSQGIDHFTDDDGTFYEDAANAAADAGITHGCAPGRFCGGDSTTRAQMASFLARAFDYPESTTDHFSDDDDSTHQADINRIADAGVTVGCSPGLYCPDAPVLRDQMATFLTRALGL